MSLKYICSNCGAEMNLSEEDIRNLARMKGVFQKRLQCALCNAFIAIPDALLKNRTEISGYRIEDRMEVEGAREIYRAEQIQKQLKVEMQVFQSPLLVKGEPARIFLQAMNRYMKLRHPNLISILDAGQNSDGIYFAAWLLEDRGSLEQRLANGRMVELRKTIHLAFVVGQLQEWLWIQQGLIYGILAPRRIWISSDNNIRLFNTILTPLERDQPASFSLDTLGSPGFMSPELLRGDDALDCRSDIYNLGATLYNMLTGTPPFKGLNSQQIQKIQANGSLPDPRTFNPDLPEAVVALLKSSLAYDPKARPQNWPIFLERLANINSAKTVSVAVPSKPDPAPVKPVPPVPTPVPTPVRKVVLARPPQKSGSPVLPPRENPHPSRLFSGILVGGIVAVMGLVFWVVVTAPAKPPSSKSVAKDGPEAALPAGRMSQNSAASQALSAMAGKAPQTVVSFDSLYNDTQEHRKNHPTDYDVLLEKYNTLLVMTETARPSWHFRILEERRDVEMMKSFALNRTIEEINRKTAEFLSDTNYSAGIVWLSNYNGSFSNETSELRGRLCSNLVQLVNVNAESDTVKHQNVQEAKNKAVIVQQKNFIEMLAKAVLDGKMDQARQIILNWNLSGDLGWPKSQQDEFLQQVTLIARLSDRIIGCYKELIGKTIQVELVNETISGKLTGVDDQQITIQTSAADGGVITVPVAFERIRSQDVLRRLNSAPPAERVLLQGIYAWQTKDEKLALTSFSSLTNSLLAVALADRIGQVFNQNREADAQNCLAALVTLAGITPTYDDAAAIAKQIDQIAFSEVQCHKIKESAQSFVKLYGNTAVAQKAIPILTALNAASPITRKADLTSLQNLIEPLKNWRAGDRPLLFSYRVDGDLVCLDLSENKTLPNLASFKAFPFKELSFRKCGITKLPPLEGFQIHRLDLSDSEIVNFSGLKDAVIDELILSGTQIANLRALKSLSLRVLIAENCVNLSDLSGLASTNLVRIVLTGSGVLDLSPLEGAPLISADFSKCALINNLKPLAQCPLQDLTLAGCSRISMLYSIKGLSLRRLDISGTAVSDLSPLAHMPLETLNLANANNISDLQPLAGSIRLKNLVLPNKSVNAACLRQHKSLETIGFPTPVGTETFWKKAQ